MEVVVLPAEERTTLLSSNEIHPLPPAPPPAPTPSSPALPHGDPPSPHTPRRLASLDVFRGLTVALMILVDDAGGAFPEINHAPWTGVTLADFVMPFFLFGVGVAVALVFKKASNKAEATGKVLARTIKLFLLGVLLQGGYFHGRGSLTYGVDLDRIRWLGVLQRIAIGYLFAAISEIWLVKNMLVDSTTTFVGKFCMQWMMAAILAATYVGLLYGLYVPDWKFEISNSSNLVISANGVVYETVHCDTRGSFSPSCNAAGLIDRLILGSRHLYQHPVYSRTKECSVNSPDYGSLPQNAPGWCLAPFDPEGILRITVTMHGFWFRRLVTASKLKPSTAEWRDLTTILKNPRLWCFLVLWYYTSDLLSPYFTTEWCGREKTQTCVRCGSYTTHPSLCATIALGSIMAAVTCFIGLHFGHLMVHGKNHMKMILLWTVTSFVLIAFGFIAKTIGMPFSKPLYTFSYMFLTSGASGLLLTVDFQHFRRPTILFQWMGMNALIVFALAASELFPAAIQGLYWGDPANNLVDLTERTLQTIFHSKRWGTMAFVLLEIFFWCLVAGFLHKKRIYIKI